MQNNDITFENFMLDVSPANMEFIIKTHDYFIQKDCAYKIATAKNGRVLSYIFPKSKKTIINYVFRKSGMIIRIYGDNVSKYSGMLNSLPEGMKNAIKKAPICKRLADPAKCNSRCPMGYIFDMDDILYKKCRYSSFMFEIKDENYQAIQSFIDHEISSRMQA